MTRTTIWAAVAVSFVLVFFTNFANYTLAFGIEPLYWIAGFAGLVGLLLVTQPIPARIPLHPVVVWCFGYALIAMLWFVPSSQSGEAWQQVQTRILSVVFLVLGLLVFAREPARDAARKAIVLATLIAVALNIYEMFFPLTFSPVAGRSAGLYANATQSGAALVLGLILGQGAVPARFRPLYALVVGVGVVATFARAAILGWLIVVGLGLLRPGDRVRTVTTFAAVATGLAVLIVSPAGTALQETLAERGVLTENVRERLEFFTAGTEDASAIQRRQVAALAWETFAEHPVVGRGTGASWEGEFVLGPHNMYLAPMVDYGVIGVFLLPTLLVAAAWGADLGRAFYVVPFVLFLAFWGFFSHNVLDERYILLAIAFVAADVAGGRRDPPALGAST